MEAEITKNPLGEKNISKLLKQFAIPSIISMLVSSLYNIVDQFFIGQKIGELGNAATNISFPLSISCVAIALLFGIGGASAFNLAMGKGKEKEGVHYIGNAIVLMIIGGIALCFVTELFLEPMLKFFGSPDNVLEYAKTYTKIVGFGFPFLIFTTGAGHLIRADGSPGYMMLCNLSGAIINTILDAIFVLVFDWGMAGAAWATVIGQTFSFALTVWYLCRFKTVTLQWEHLILHWRYIKRILALGVASGANQLSMMLVQIVMNRSLKHYGSMSVYGEAIPIACVGIVTKVNQVFMAFIIGISQGLQPIVSFNYGAGKYQRVNKTYKKAISYGILLSVIAFLLFQFLPRQIISIFGDGSAEYFRFSINYFRIFLFFTFLNFMQPISSLLFTSIGKPQRGIFLSLTRQIIFLLPLILIFPLFMGIDGIMFAGPVADLTAAVISIVMVIVEFRRPEYKNLN